MAKITDVYVCVLSWVRLFVTRWTLANQAPLSMGLCRQEYWGGLPFPPPGDLPDPGTDPHLCTAGRFLTAEPSGKPQIRGKSPKASHAVCFLHKAVIRKL